MRFWPAEKACTLHISTMQSSGHAPQRSVNPWSYPLPHTTTSLQYQENRPSAVETLQGSCCLVPPSLPAHPLTFLMPSLPTPQAQNQAIRTMVQRENDIAETGRGKEVDELSSLSGHQASSRTKKTRSASRCVQTRLRVGKASHAVLFTGHRSTTSSSAQSFNDRSKTNTKP